MYELLYPLFSGVISTFLENPIGQTFGFLGMGVLIYGFLQQDDTKTLKILTVANAVWIVHYAFL